MKLTKHEKCIFFLLLILGVAFRLGSGVHWLTDICGGVLISSALLLAFSAYLEKNDGR